ncbi:MAG: hypothetical protein HY096_09890 [Nitrospinae bacterium]|nr:hypothetical protein [Nitrospinota bacterium]
MKRCLLISLCILAFVIGISHAEQIVAKKAGVGDTFTTIESVWNRGYKKEVPMGDGSKTVTIGFDKGSAFSYTTGLLGYAFGNSERAGRLEGNAKGLFGAVIGVNPTKQQFFQGIKDLMPTDFALIGAYVNKNDPLRHWKKEIYTFKSKKLSQLQGISEAFPYKQYKYTLGNFTLIINYDIDNEDKVANFLLFLGLSDSNIEDMKKIDANPFK